MSSQKMNTRGVKANVPEQLKKHTLQELRDS